METDHAMIEAFKEAAWMVDETMQEEFDLWMEDLGNTRAQMAQFNKTLDLFQTMKTMLRNVAGDKGMGLEDINNKLDKIQKDLDVLHSVCGN